MKKFWIYKRTSRTVLVCFASWWHNGSTKELIHLKENVHCTLQAICQINTVVRFVSTSAKLGTC